MHIEKGLAAVWVGSHIGVTYGYYSNTEFLANCMCSE